MKEEIKAIIFDAGGVLTLPKSKLPLRGVHEFIAKKLKISLDQWFDAIDSSYAKAIEGKLSEEKTLSTISKNLNISQEKLEKYILKAYKENFMQNKQLFEQAFKIKKQGYKIAILSDQWYLSKKALLLKQYTKKFDEVIISCDAGMRKPNPKIYKLILKKLKLPARQTLFIDNQKWNIKPAKKLGMKTILFENNKQCFNELKKLRVSK